MAEFVHNEYTYRIFDEFEKGKGHVFIQARAGTGKTTSLIEMLNHFYANLNLYPEYMQNALVCFIAFSNEVKKDLDKRVPKGERNYYDTQVNKLITNLIRNDFLDRVTDSDYKMAIDAVEAYIKRIAGRKGEAPSLLQETLKSLQDKNLDQAEIFSQLVMEDLSDIHVKTFHGLGYGILKSVYEKHGTLLHLDEDKYHKIVKDFIKTKVDSAGYLEVMSALKILANHSRLSLVDVFDQKLMRELAWQYEIDLDKKRPDLMKSVLRWLPEIMSIGENQARDNGTIDYTDMIYLPIKWELQAPTRYKLMFIDEAQDLSKVTRNLIIKQALDPQGRAFFIGDENQCVIDGTLIGGHRAEDIQTGDAILSGFGRGMITEGLVLNAYHRKVTNEPVVTIKTKSGKQITTTPNHTHFAGYVSEFGEEYFYTYLMYKNNVGYRVGVTRKKSERKTGRGGSTIGFKGRLTQEGADKIWLLGAFDNENDSRYHEAYYAFKYGIPTIPFRTRKSSPNGRGMMLDQVRIDKLFQSLPTFESGERLLKDLGLSFEHPHHTPKGSPISDRKNFTIIMCADPRGSHTLHRCELSIKSAKDAEALKNVGIKLTDNGKGTGWRLRFYTQKLEEIYDLLKRVRSVLEVNLIESAYLSSGNSLPFIPACHILKGMAIFVEDNGVLIKDEVVDVSTSLYTGGLHDFDVDKYHNYIANGIASHNSIMGFAGADVHSVRDTIKLTGAQELPLDICYRCPTSHIELAKKLVPAIKAHANAKSGTIVLASSDMLTQVVQPGDMVLCRNTAPLFQKAIECLRAKIPARIRGRDLCENMISVLKKIEKAAESKNQYSYDRLDVLIDDWAVEEIRYLIKRESSEAAIQTVNDKRETLQICYKDIDAKSTTELINGIRSLIPSNKGEGRNISAVEFSTVHRVKGLEAERIFILEPNKLPAIWQKQQSWQLEQEKNLLYVAITRSKDYLCILGDENVWKPYVGTIKPTHSYTFSDGKWILKLNTKGVKDTLNEFMVGANKAAEVASEAVTIEPHQDLLF